MERGDGHGSCEFVGVASARVHRVQHPQGVRRKVEQVARVHDNEKKGGVVARDGRVGCAW